MEINILCLSFKFVRHAKSNTSIRKNIKGKKPSAKNTRLLVWMIRFVRSFQCRCANRCCWFFFSNCAKVVRHYYGLGKMVWNAKKCRHLNTSDDKFMRESMKCCFISSLDVCLRVSLCTATNKYWDYLNLNCYHIQVEFLFACYAQTIIVCFDAPDTHTPTLPKANNGRFFLRLRTNPINTDRTTVLCNHERDSCKRSTYRQTDRQQERER